MALQCICRQTWKKQQVEMSAGVFMDQGMTHQHSLVEMALSQRWPPSSGGLNTPRSILLQEGTTPRAPQGREKHALVAATI